jgi:hypothetical protein
VKARKDSSGWVSLSGSSPNHQDDRRSPEGKKRKAKQSAGPLLASRMKRTKDVRIELILFFLRDGVQKKEVLDGNRGRARITRREGRRDGLVLSFGQVRQGDAIEGAGSSPCQLNAACQGDGCNGKRDIPRDTLILGLLRISLVGPSDSSMQHKHACRHDENCE